MAKQTTPAPQPPADEPDTMGMPDEPDVPMTGGVPDGHAQAAQRNADSMLGMQQKMRQQLGKSGY